MMDWLKPSVSKAIIAISIVLAGTAITQNAERCKYETGFLCGVVKLSTAHDLTAFATLATGALGFAGVIFTLAQSARLARKREEEQRKLEVSGLCRIFATELINLRAIFSEKTRQLSRLYKGQKDLNIHDFGERASNSLNGISETPRRIIYDRNVDKIGILPSDLSARIVAVYSNLDYVDNLLKNYSPSLTKTLLIYGKYQNFVAISTQVIDALLIASEWRTPNPAGDLERAFLLPVEHVVLDADEEIAQLQRMVRVEVDEDKAEG